MKITKIIKITKIMKKKKKQLKKLNKNSKIIPEFKNYVKILLMKTKRIKIYYMRSFSKT